MLCDFCHGSGAEDGPGFEWPIRCIVCGGSGMEPEHEDDDFDDGPRIVCHQNNPLSEILRDALKKNAT